MEATTAFLRLLEPERLPISTEISPDDAMYAGNLDHYLGVGHSALRCIGAALTLTGSPEPGRLLDLPCGHGRVMRALRAGFPDAELTACDLDPAAVEYCQRTFGATGAAAARDPREIQLPGSYDLIWCGSLFTHLPAKKWKTFLTMFSQWLSPGGLLLFTTHGRNTESWLRRGRTDVGMTIEQMYGLPRTSTDTLLADFERSGFGYVDYPEQEGYGISLSALPFIVGLIRRATSLQLVASFERGWDQHQDVIGCLKTRASLH